LCYLGRSFQHSTRLNLLNYKEIKNEDFVAKWANSLNIC